MIYCSVFIVSEFEVSSWFDFVFHYLIEKMSNNKIISVDASLLFLIILQKKIWEHVFEACQISVNT